MSDFYSFFMCQYLFIFHIAVIEFFRVFPSWFPRILLILTNLVINPKHLTEPHYFRFGHFLIYARLLDNCLSNVVSPV